MDKFQASVQDIQGRIHFCVLICILGFVWRIDGLSWSQMRREAGGQGIQFLLSSSGSSSLNVNSFSFTVLMVLLSDRTWNQDLANAAI